MLSDPALSCSAVAEISCMLAAISSITADTLPALSLTAVIWPFIFAEASCRASDLLLISFIISCSFSINELIPSTSSPISSSDFTSILAVKSPLLSSIFLIISFSWRFADFNGLIINIIITIMAAPMTNMIARMTAYTIIDWLYCSFNWLDASLTCALINVLRLSAAVSSLEVILSSPSAVSSK